MSIIAVTGGPCSGKTSLLNFLREKGAVTLCVDKWVHHLYRDKHSLIYRTIVKEFPEVVDKRKIIRRRKLREIVFSQPHRLKQLERIIHPFIIDRLKKWIDKHKDRNGIYLVEVPLLFEKRLETLFDKVILIDVKADILCHRMQEKWGISKSEAKRRLKLFLPISFKKQKSDFIIDNNNTLNKFKKEGEKLWGQLRKRG